MQYESHYQGWMFWFYENESVRKNIFEFDYVMRWNLFFFKVSKVVLRFENKFLKVNNFKCLEKDECYK